MKKLALFLLMALPFMIGMTSCDDDKDLPNVEITVDFAEGTEVDGVVTVPQGDNIVIESVTAKNKEAGKGALVANVRYFINGLPMGYSMVSPFAFAIPTENMKVGGKYNLDLECTVLAVDKSLATAVLSIPVTIIEKVEVPETPENPDNGDNSGEPTEQNL